MSMPRGVLLFGACLPAFLVLSTLNAGGYRYGASDQAFYLPVVLKHLDPMLYPRDTALLDAQGKLTTYDEVIAGLVRLTGASVPTIFTVLYVTSLVLIAAGAWLVAIRLYRTEWAVVALLVAMTLRHAIARSGTNTLEGYFHPRQVVYGLGLIAVAAFLRGRIGAAAVLVLAAGALHPTAALWFAVWLAAAAAILRSDVRRWLTFLSVPAGAAAVWTLTGGPLAGRLGTMEHEWLRMLQSKDYLFPLRWPAYAWVLNLGYGVIVGLVYRQRRRAGLVEPAERALVLGLMVLGACFAAALVAQAARIVLAFQLQPARLFLLFDFFATLYVIWALAEGRRMRASRARLAALLLLAFSVVRGASVVASGRPVFQPRVPDDHWGRVMAWAKTTDRASGWLADPLHAAVYGTSVRVAAERDVYVEAIKDAALGIYDREIARRADERFRTIKDFHLLTASDVRAIGLEHNLDYFVTEHPVDLPVVFESGPLRVYRLR